MKIENARKLIPEIRLFSRSVKNEDIYYILNKEKNLYRYSHATNSLRKVGGVEDYPEVQHITDSLDLGYIDIPLDSFDLNLDSYDELMIRPLRWYTNKKLPSFVKKLKINLADYVGKRFNLERDMEDIITKIEEKIEDKFYFGYPEEVRSVRLKFWLLLKTNNLRKRR